MYKTWPEACPSPHHPSSNSQRSALTFNSSQIQFLSSWGQLHAFKTKILLLRFIYAHVCAWIYHTCMPIYSIHIILFPVFSGLSMPFYHSVEITPLSLFFCIAAINCKRTHCHIEHYFSAGAKIWACHMKLHKTDDTNKPKNS